LTGIQLENTLAAHVRGCFCLYSASRNLPHWPAAGSLTRPSVLLFSTHTASVALPLHWLTRQTLLGLAQRSSPLDQPHCHAALPWTISLPPQPPLSPLSLALPLPLALPQPHPTQLLQPAF